MLKKSSALLSAACVFSIIATAPGEAAADGGGGGGIIIKAVENQGTKARPLTSGTDEPLDPVDDRAAYGGGGGTIDIKNSARHAATVRPLTGGAGDPDVAEDRTQYTGGHGTVKLGAAESRLPITGGDRPRDPVDDRAAYGGGGGTIDIKYSARHAATARPLTGGAHDPELPVNDRAAARPLTGGANDPREVINDRVAVTDPTVLRRFGVDPNDPYTVVYAAPGVDLYGEMAAAPIGREVKKDADAATAATLEAFQYSSALGSDFRPFGNPTQTIGALVQNFSDLRLFDGGVWYAQLPDPLNGTRLVWIDVWYGRGASTDRPVLSFVESCQPFGTAGPTEVTILASASNFSERGNGRGNYHALANVASSQSALDPRDCSYSIFYTAAPGSSSHVIQRAQITHRQPN